MGTLGDPKTWPPYMNPKDCSQGFCPLSCPKWCYLIFHTAPPPLAFPNDYSKTTPTFPPLAIAIIGILASALLIVGYYALISKYCRNSSASSRRENHPPNNIQVEDDQEEDNNGDNHEPWVAIRSNGLDEDLIKSIALVKYKKGDGLIGSNNDCSVCLGEFLEDDTLRLLPKCSHVFHVACIDTWLKSHSNCPLCRANIIVVDNNNNSSSSSSSNDNNNNNNNDNEHQAQDDHGTRTILTNQVESEEISSSGQGREMGFAEQARVNLPKCPWLRTRSDVGVRDNGKGNMIRRSVSMDHCNETRVSISDILRFINHGEEDCHVEHCELHDEALKGAAGESSKCGGGSRMLHEAVSSAAIKRSFSSGRFLFSKHCRGKSAVIPA